MSDRLFPALEEKFDPRAQAVDEPEILEAIYRGMRAAEDFVVRTSAEIMQLAIGAAEFTSITGPLIRGVRGGPFGAAAFIPETLRSPESGREIEFRSWWPTLDQPQKVSLEFDQVCSWRVVALGVNLVEVIGRSRAHGEMTAIDYCQAVTGRNGWKYFAGLATSADPCQMCAGALTWWRPRYVLSGAGLVDTVLEGFHEGLPPELVERMRAEPESFKLEDSPWVGSFREMGTYVEVGVCREEVRRRLFRPYFGELKATIYNSGPDDPTG